MGGKEAVFFMVVTYKCPQCGAAMEFDGQSGQLHQKLSFLHDRTPPSLWAWASSCPPWLLARRFLVSYMMRARVMTP